MTLTAGVLFSGIGGWDLGAERAGVRVLWGCEVDKYCTKVLTKRWPDAPIYPDVRTLDPKEVAPVDILIASPPCQDLSVAGKRAGLAGARSGLFYDFVRIAAALRPAWVLMEQVPGLVSSHKGEDFRQVIEAITELGYGLSWRCLDSRHLGVPQRRRRLYFVGRLGEPCPFEVLFEPEGRGGDPEARRAAGAEAPRAVGDGLAGALGGHHPRNDLDSNGAYVPESAYAVTARDYKGVSQREGVTTLVAEETSHALRAQAQSAHAADQESYVVDKDVAPTLRDHTRPTSNGDGGVIAIRSDAVREGVSKTPSPDAEGRVRLRDPGLGVYEDGLAPTLDSTAPHMVQEKPIAFAWQQGDDSKFNKNGRGRSWLVRAGDYAGSVQAQRVDAVSIPAETTHTLKAEGADASEDGTGRGVPMVVEERKVFSIMPQNSSKDYKAREVPVTQPLMASGQSHGDQGGDVVLEVAAPLTHGGNPNSNAPGRRKEDDTNLVVESVALRGREGGATAETGGDQSHALRSSAGGGDKEHVAIYRKSKRAQTDQDDETWVESEESNTLNAFDVGDARATELVGYISPRAVRNSNSAHEVGIKDGSVHDTLQSDGPGAVGLAQPLRSNPYNNSDPTMEAKMHVAPAGIVRRLTVTECERLQAFPDGFTCLEVDWVTHPDIEGPYLGFPDGTPYSTEECSCPDGPRYRALGNAVTTNAAFWVVQRLVRWVEFNEAATGIAKWVVADTIPDWLREQSV